MKAKLLLVLTLANVVLLAFSLAQTRVVAAANAQRPCSGGALWKLSMTGAAFGPL